MPQVLALAGVALTSVAKMENSLQLGPDFLWCRDGHDKFRNYGIEIYAGVDAYSRRTQRMYVGNSDRKQISNCY
jgi:hypothetical protein